MTNLNPKYFFFLTVLLSLCLFTLPAIVNYIVDPFFISHDRYMSHIQFSGYDRYQNAGLINTLLSDETKKIDAIIVGTSMSENLPVEVFKNQYGANALKLTLAGGRPRELDAIVKRAIEVGHVKKVVWEIHRKYELEDPMAQHKKSPLPLFLYNKSRIDDWRYFFNSDVLHYSKKILKRKLAGRTALERLYMWEDKASFKAFSSNNNMPKLIDIMKGSEPLISSIEEIDGEYNFLNLQDNLFKTLHQNPDIEFTLFFPPISYFAHIKNGQELFKKQMLMRRALLKEVDGLAHVTVHGFDLWKNVPEVLSNYRDASHYNPQISYRMAESMLSFDSIITHDKWLEYTEEHIKRIQLFKQSILVK